MIQKKVTVVFGPMASGKTHNAEALKTFFGADSIVDNYPHWLYRQPLPDDNALVLTDDLSATMKKLVGNYSLYQVYYLQEALRQMAEAGPEKQ